MNESEIEKNLENYDYKNYRGIDEDRRRLHYSQKKMSFLGVGKEENKDENDESNIDQLENVPENEENNVGHVNSHNETPDATTDKKNDLENSDLKQ